MTVDRAPLLRRIGPPLRAAILEHYRPDSCIASTRIALDQLRALHIPARALMVEAQVFNKAMVDRVNAEGHFPQNQEERERWFAESGAHGIGLGYADPRRTDLNPELNGIHVVVIVERAWLWDMAIDQVHRPQHGIIFDQPLVARLGSEPERFLSALRPLVIQGSNGVVIRYAAKPNDHRHEVSPNWRADGADAPTRKRIVTAAHEGIVQALRSAPLR